MTTGLGIRLTCPSCHSPDTKRVDEHWRQCNKCRTSYTSDPEMDPLVYEAALATLVPFFNACREAGYIAIEIEEPVEFPETCDYRWLTTIRGLHAHGTDPRSSPAGYPAIWDLARLVAPSVGGSDHQIQLKTHTLPPGRHILL